MAYSAYPRKGDLEDLFSIHNVADEKSLIPPAFFVHN